MLRTIAKLYQKIGVKPEMEVFDLGQLRFANQMVKEGLIYGPAMYQLCLGIPWGAGANSTTMTSMVSQLPQGVFLVWLRFKPRTDAHGRSGHASWRNLRVSLEDNLYLEKGVPASNGELVEKVIRIIRDLGDRPCTADET